MTISHVIYLEFARLIVSWQWVTEVELHVRSSACDLMLNMSQRVTLSLSSTHNHHTNDAARSHHHMLPND